MRLTSLHKLILTTSIAVISIAILAGFFWRLADLIDDVRLEIAQANSRIANLEEQRKHAVLFARLTDERPDDFGRIVGYFVDPPNPVTFIEALEGLAKRTNNQIKLDVGSATVSEDELIFNVLVEGTKESVLKYLRLVELLSYELRVENFDFKSLAPQTQPVAGSGSRAELQITVRVKTLFGP